MCSELVNIFVIFYHGVVYLITNLLYFIYLYLIILTLMLHKKHYQILCNYTNIIVLIYSITVTIKVYIKQELYEYYTSPFFI